MSRRSPLRELFLFRVREFVRQPEVLFWAFLFPMILIVVLGIAFRPKPAPPVRVLLAFTESDARSVAIRDTLARSPAVTLKSLPREEAALALLRGDAALLVLPTDPPTYRFDETHPEARATRLVVDQALQVDRGRRDAFAASEETVVAPGGRYIDWLVPGLLGMQVMNGCLWGIGFSLVEMRSRKLLKRFAVTPMRRTHFLLASAIQRALVVGLEAVILIAFARLCFGVHVLGSPAAFAIVTALGTLAFASIGLLVAARPSSPEVAAGLMNIPMLPQMVVSGVFFSSSQFPEWVMPAIKILPLTALLDALRRIANEGAGLDAVLRELVVLGLWGVVTLALALKLFRWS